MKINHKTVNVDEFQYRLHFKLQLTLRNNMKTLKKVLPLLIILPFLLNFTIDFSGNDKKQEATKWKFDKAHSAVSFTIRHIFTPVLGQFNEYDGDVYFDPNNLKESKIDVKIQVSSIDTRNQKRDSHLQSPDFFDAKKFPEIRFKSSSFKKTGNNEFVAVGELTIKDVAKTIELPFKLLGIADHPMAKGKKIAAFETTTQLNRNEYNVGSGEWVETAVVGEDVDVKITLELISE